MQVDSFISLEEIDSYLNLEDRVNLGVLSQLAAECSREELEAEFNKACAIMLGLLARERSLSENIEGEVEEFEIDITEALEPIWEAIDGLAEILNEVIAGQKSHSDLILKVAEQQKLIGNMFLENAKKTR